MEERKQVEFEIKKYLWEKREERTKVYYLLPVGIKYIKLNLDKLEIEDELKEKFNERYELLINNKDQFSFTLINDLIKKVFDVKRVNIEQYIQKDIFNDKNYIELMVKYINLIEENEFRELINNCLSHFSPRYMRELSDKISSREIREFATKLLDVKENEIYVDPMCGYSTSAYCLENNSEYIGYDTDQKSLEISKILLKIAGFSRVNLENNDFLMDRREAIADKLFVQYNLNEKVSNDVKTRYGIGLNEYDVAVIEQSYRYLNDKGVAVICVPSKVLKVGNNSENAFVRTRQKLVREGLKAVISLPALWGFSAINTNFLVLEKGYKGDIEFIDVSNNIPKDDRRRLEISKLIANLYNKDSYDSKLIVNVKREEITDNCLLIPGLYNGALEKTMYADGVARSFVKEDGRATNSVNSLDRRIREVKKEVAKLNKELGELLKEEII